jgi:hypothetical protein
MIFNLSAQQNWTHKVRIAGNPLSNEEIETIIKNAKDSYVFGIEVDNDITGRYESFLDPTEKLEAIRKVTEEAHKINNKTFVYIAGLECITSDADNKKNTFYKDHPDWVQRDINGRPAIFGAMMLSGYQKVMKMSGLVHTHLNGEKFICRESGKLLLLE